MERQIRYGLLTTLLAASTLLLAACDGDRALEATGPAVVEPAATPAQEGSGHPMSPVAVDEVPMDSPYEPEDIGPDNRQSAPDDAVTDPEDVRPLPASP